LIFYDFLFLPELAGARESEAWAGGVFRFSLSFQYFGKGILLKDGNADDMDDMALYRYISLRC
jgi:hypothetical protein